MGEGVINVNDFPSIQEAINAALLPDSPAEVFFPTGHYIIDSPINVTTTDKGLRLFGAGYASELTFNINEPNKAAITVNHQVQSVFEIADLRINGHFTRALELGGPGSNIRIIHCYISGATMDPCPECAHDPHKVEPGVCAGVSVHSLSDVWIENNTVFGNGFMRHNTPFGYDIVKLADAPQNEPSRWSNIHVRNNKINGEHTVAAVTIYDANDSDAIGNTIDQGNHGNGESNGYGILFYKSEKNAENLYRNKVVNNTVSNSAGIGIYLAGCRYSLIQGNTIMDAVKNQSDRILEAGAIGLFGGFNSVIGNVIHSSGKAGIAFSGRQTIIEGNYIDGTTTAAIWVNGQVLPTAVRVSCDRSIISSNSLFKVGKYGILIWPTPVEGLRIVGNSLGYGNLQGIAVGIDPDSPKSNYLTNATIANNQVTGFNGFSITVTGDRIIICGNVVTEGKDYGIDCRATHSIIEDNIVRDCTYGYNNDADFVQLRNNDLSGNTVGSINIVSGGATLAQSGNILQ